MNLSEIKKNPVQTLSFMERYINDGSPSGYSFSNTSSPSTAPKSFTKKFSLFELLPMKDVKVHNLGFFPRELFSVEHISGKAMFIHPDLVEEKIIDILCSKEKKPSRFFVRPTSSARTLELLCTDNKGFLKLHYEKHLGRIRRQLTLKHAQAAIENTQILDYLVSNDLMPETFAFFPEVGGRVFEYNKEKLPIFLGMVWRPFEIRGKNASKIAYLIPGFSLFAKNAYDSDGNTLLCQLGEVHDDKIKFLIEDILIPLIKSYFSMLINGGLQGEWHAQNVLFGFDEDWNCVSTILRDMESVDRDLGIIKNSSYKIKLESYPYKCIKTDQNYAIRHSFMFDYKFGEYLLAPLIDHACDCWDIDVSVINSQIVDFVMMQIKQFDKDFFPLNGCWYSFSKQLIDQSVPERPYLCNQNPRFRKIN